MHFERYLHSKWLKLVIAAVCIFYGWLWDSRWFAALVIGAAAFAIATFSLPKIIQAALGVEKAPYIGSLGLALLFTTMLPIRVLTDRDNLYNFAAALALPAPLVKLANGIENLSITGLTFGLAFCTIFALWKWLRQPSIPYTQDASRQDEQPGSGSQVLVVLLYALPCLVVWSIFLYGFWPGNMFTDTYTQWIQFTHMTLDDWHPVAHTLLEFLLTRIWYSPAIISIFQIIAMALAWGWAMQYFENKRLPRAALFMLSWGFALLPYNGVQLITLVKDELYTVFNFVLVFLLGVIWVSRGGWLDRRGNQILLGVFMALPFLFRHNGLLTLLLAPLALLLFYRRRWKGILTASLTGILIIAGIRNGLAFGMLKAKQNTDAVLYVVPIQHISAVGNYGGKYTTTQEEILQEIAPIEVWQHAYNPYDADYISKDWGVRRDADIYKKIERNKTGLMRTFFELFVKYPGVMIRSELDLMNPIWAIAFIEKEPAWLYKYSIQSYPPPAGVDASLFIQPNLSSPIKTLLNQFLSASNQPATAPFFWRGGIYFFLTLMLALIYFFTRGRDSLLLFIPSLANILSLFLTMPMQNFRYMYPYIACVPLLVLFGFVHRQK